MLLGAWLVASVLAVAEDGRPAEPEIRAEGGAVTIRAWNVPLSQILDRLASVTGMGLTYEGTRPTTPVTVSMQGISEPEAVLKLMEGLGVSYVFRTDETAQHVDLLIVTGAGAGTLVTSTPASVPEPQYEEPVVDYAHVPVEPAPPDAAAQPQKPEVGNPYLGLPANFPHPVPPQGDPVGPRNPPYPTMPTFPQGGSYPSR